MSGLTLSEFSDKVSEIMPVIMRTFYKRDSDGFFKTKITMAQFVVLDILVRDGESRMTDLAHLLNLTTAAMTGVVERLVRDGYVTRVSDASDRRTIKVRPTARGNKIVKTVVDHRKKMVGSMFEKVSQTDREEYLRILTIIQGHLKEGEVKVQ